MDGPCKLMHLHDDDVRGEAVRVVDFSALQSGNVWIVISLEVVGQCGIQTNNNGNTF